MLAPLFVRNDLGAALACEVDDLELVPQIAVHHRCVEAVCLAAGAAHGLVEPLLEAVVAKHLLAVAALHVLLVHDVEADWAEERVDELLVGFNCILL